MKFPRKIKYYYNPPEILKRFFDNFTWNSPCDEIILTFDDGPNPETTPKILRTLDTMKTKALFFAVGENLVKYKSLAEEILDEGHLLGNHTQSHQILTRISERERQKAIKTVQDFAFEKFNYEIKFFRPPHGRFPINLARTLHDFGLKNIMWSLLTYDYENNYNIVKFAIDKFLGFNSLVVFHDSKKSANVIEDALKLLFEKTLEKKFTIGNPAQCLK